MSEDKMPELKPCPFCGHALDANDEDTVHPATVGWVDSVIHGSRVYKNFREVPKSNWCYSINCPESAGGCGAEILGDGKKQAIDKWNTRDNSHVQHLIDQAKAEQREACYKAVLVAASYGIDGDVDDMISVGNASEAILTATEDK